MQNSGFSADDLWMGPSKTLDLNCLVRGDLSESPELLTVWFSDKVIHRPATWGGINFVIVAVGFKENISSQREILKKKIMTENNITLQGSYLRNICKIAAK